MRSVPTLECKVLGQCEVSQRSSEGVLGQCEVFQRLSEGGPGTVRGVPTLEQVVLGQCEVSQHLSGKSWDSAKCPNT